MDALFARISEKKHIIEAPESLYLVVGLGNPGREYQNTRHNIGFMAVDAFARSVNVTFSKVQSKALITKTTLENSQLILAKPQTYMNLSGQAVSGLLNYYKIPKEHLIVIHDDIDLPLGTIRIRPGGGSAGQKGIGSIIEKLGSQEFARIRLGVGRPQGQMDAAAFVLLPIAKEDMEFLPVLFSKVNEAIRQFITNGLDAAMNNYNGTF